jgi:hypothetical protein
MPLETLYQFNADPWQEYRQALKRTDRTAQLDHAARALCVLQALSPAQVEDFMRQVQGKKAATL